MKWEKEKLGEICEILDNKRKPISKNKRIAGEYPYYGATGIVDYVNDFIFDERLVLVGEDGAKWCSGDNTAFIVEGKVWVNNHAHVLKPKNNLIDSYLVYYLNHQDLSDYITGLTVPKLNQEKLRSIPIPLPSLEEQKTIVAKLDQAFAAIDQAKANIEKNIANAKELFQSKLNQIFSQKGDGWVEKRIKDVALVTAGQSPEGKYYNDKGIGLPFYQGKKEFTEKLIGEPKVWTEKITKEALEGDVLMSVRAPVGPINFATQKCCIGRGLASIRVKENFDKEFLFFYFKNIENQLTGNSGAVFNSINKNQIEQIQIFYPNIIEQRNIVSRLVNLQEQTNLLVTKYQQKLANLEELKKSILDKAFKGELS